MEQKYFLILSLLIISVEAFGQNDKQLLTSKELIKLENVLDSTNAKSLNNLKIDGKVDSPMRLTCGCPKTGAPLYLLKIEQHLYLLDSFALIKPIWISDIHVVDEKSQLVQYGPLAKNGVIIITLFPKPSKQIKSSLRKFDVLKTD